MMILRQNLKIDSNMFSINSQIFRYSRSKPLGGGREIVVVVVVVAGVVVVVVVVPAWGPFERPRRQLCPWPCTEKRGVRRRDRCPEIPTF